MTTARARELGAAYRALMGKHYPAMAVVEVSGLIEDRAKLEIETTAVVPSDTGRHFADPGVRRLYLGLATMGRDGARAIRLLMWTMKPPMNGSSRSIA